MNKKEITKSKILSIKISDAELVQVVIPCQIFEHTGLSLSGYSMDKSKNL